MVKVYVPRAGLAGAIASLRHLGLAIADIVPGTPSVGNSGEFNRSNGSGGWLTSLLSATATALISSYNQVNFNTQTTFRVTNAALDVLRLDATTLASVATGRVLSWNGTQNVYSRPPEVMYFTSNVGGASVNITVAQMTDAVRTFCAIGVGQTFNLPDNASCQQGATTVIADVLGTAGTNPITIASQVISGDTIQGTATIQITTNFGFARIQKRFGSTDWMVVG